MKNIFLTLLILIFSISWGFSRTQNTITNETVQLGTATLHNLNNPLKLNGQWAFKNHAFVDPSLPIEYYTDFKEIDNPRTKDGKKLLVDNYGTFALKIQGLQKNTIYALHFSENYSAITAFINGREFYHAGQVGTNYHREIFDWDAKTVLLPTRNKTEITLVFHISNFHTSIGGLKLAPEILIINNKNNVFLIPIIINAGIFAVLFIMSAIFISLYFFYKKELVSFDFGLFSLGFAVRILCYDVFLIKYFIPQIQGEVLYRLGYFTLPFVVIFGELFLLNLFAPQKRFLKFTIIPFIIYGILCMFSPLKVFSDLLIYIHIYLLCIVLLCMFFIIQSLIHKNKIAVYFLIGLLLFSIFAIRDILISNKIINGFFLSQFGLLFLVIPMAVIVIQQFAQSHIKVRTISDNIIKINNTFQKFVPVEFMNYLQKKEVTKIYLGDNKLENMYIAFIHFKKSPHLKATDERIILFELYNQVLADINPLIKKYNGFIDKYLAEGIMIIFHGTAYETIMCIVEIYTLLSHSEKYATLNTVQFSSGVHFGPLMLGTIGEENRMDSTVISDAVNIASRMHIYSWQKGIPILISEQVAKQLNNPQNFNIKLHGNIKFKGKEQIIKVFEVTI